MASKRNGVKTREWAKHLKPEGKRAHNKDVRRAGQDEAEETLMECGKCGEIALPQGGGECDNCSYPQYF